MDDLFLIILALLLVALNGFFVAAEFAIVKLRRTRAEELARAHGWRGRALAAVHRKLDAYLSACQLGITLASLGLGWIGEPAFARLLGGPLAALGVADPETVETIAFVTAFLLISYLHIVVGELAPKSAALRMPEAMSLWTAAPLFAFYWAMVPFIWVLNASANALLRIVRLGGAAGGADQPYSPEELRVILHRTHAQAEEPREASLARVAAHTLELPGLHASDVMRPYRELIMVRSDESFAEVRRTLQAHRYSRYPYLDAGRGELVGVLHLKDFFAEPPGDDFPVRLRRQVRPVERVWPDAPLLDLLRQFQLGSPHLALVEDGGQVVGFLTLEDVLEAIFGEIVDEHDRDRPQRARRDPQWLEDGALLVRGDTPLFKLERELGLAIPEAQTVSTVTGLFMHRLDRLPQRGDETPIGPYVAQVLRTQGAAVQAIRLVRGGEGEGEGG